MLTTRRGTIFINTQFEGIHCYPDAPDEVSFLREPHRHMFGVNVEVEVLHTDRELEFILVKRKVDQYIQTVHCDNGTWALGSMSCEQIAGIVFDFVRDELVGHGNGRTRELMVAVDEDGENGARLVGYV